MPSHRNSNVGHGRKVGKNPVGSALLKNQQRSKQKQQRQRRGERPEDDEIEAPKVIFKSQLALGMVGEAHRLDSHKAGSGFRGPNRGPIESKLDMTDLEELMYDAELADRDFEANRTEGASIVTNTGRVIASGFSVDELEEAREENQINLKVPRRPQWDASTSTQELDAMERADFLEWRRKLALLEENPMLVLSPFEKNLEVWKQLWRVVERSHLVVQIVDARNPLFFRCPDLELYVKETGKDKHSMLLLNKADLLSPEQRAAWSEWLTARDISFLFWSANSSMDQEEGMNAVEVGPYSVEGDVLNREQLLHHLDKLGRTICKVPRSKQVVVGMIGYPNVGKSSTINAICQEKKVAVASRPGKTRHFQTVSLDDNMMLCDCPGLVFPSLSQSKADMLCNGVLPIDQMRDHGEPIALVCKRIPKRVLRSIYGLALAKEDEILEDADVVGGAEAEAAHARQDFVQSPENFIEEYAVKRGLTVKHGRMDESKAARMILKDIVNGKLLYAYAPPTRGTMFASVAQTNNSSVME